MGSLVDVDPWPSLYFTPRLIITLTVVIPWKTGKNSHLAQFNLPYRLSITFPTIFVPPWHPRFSCVILTVVLGGNKACKCPIPISWPRYHNSKTLVSQDSARPIVNAGLFLPANLAMEDTAVLSPAWTCLFPANFFIYLTLGKKCQQPTS